MTRYVQIVVALLATTALVAPLGDAAAQPARGAGPAFERVREVMNNRFKDLKLTGDPDKDFAALLIAHHEDLVFLAKTQLEFGGDRHLRQLAQRLDEETGKQISELKGWQARSRQADYKAQPDQPPHGSGPLNRQAQASPPPPSSPPTSPTAAAPASQSSANLPLVTGTVESVDAAQGKLTIDHGPIPNLNMDGMTMVFRAADPGMVRTVKKGDRIQFSADRVNGQITVTKIQKAR